LVFQEGTGDYPTTQQVAQVPLTRHVARVMNRKAQLLLFALGLAAFGVLIERAGPSRLVEDIKTSGWAVPAVIAVYGAVYVLNTIGWVLTMIEPPRLAFGKALMVNIAAFSINYMTPFASIGGEPFKIVAASQWMGARNATASVLNYRLVHIQAHLFVFLTGTVLAFFVLPSGIVPIWTLALLAIVLVALLSLLIAAHREGVIERLFDLVNRIPLINRLTKRLEPRRAALIEVDRQLIELHRKSPARYYGALANEYVARVVSMLEFWIIARAMGHPVSFATAFLIGSFSSLIVNVFFFLPFNVGSKEGGLYFIFRAVGLPADIGVAAAVLSRIRELTWIGIGLLLVLAIRKKPDYSQRA
jgi:hypothetical protein